jgi:ribosomal protein S18 acetylase RimI-like enzyme
MGFTIQPASWRDLGELRVLEQECFGKDAWPLFDLIGILTFPGIVRLKAVVDDRMAGFIGGDMRPREGVGWITTIGVSSPYRRQGMAFALLAACEEAMGLPFVRLCVRRSNLGAQQLYQKAGYQPSAVWSQYYDDKEDALVLQKSR